MTFNINFKIKKSMLNKNRKKTVPKKTDGNQAENHKSEKKSFQRNYLKKKNKHRKQTTPIYYLNEFIYIFKKLSMPEIYFFYTFDHSVRKVIYGKKYKYPIAIPSLIATVKIIPS